MTLKTINLTFGSFLSVYETLSYVPHPTDPSKTLLKQEATVQVEGVPLNRYMEDVLTKNISTNAGKGRQGLEWVIGKLNAEVRCTQRGDRFGLLDTNTKTNTTFHFLFASR